MSGAGRGWVDLRPGERTTTFAAFTTLLLLTAAHTQIETARDAMFLAKLPASRLPWMYIGIAVLGVLLSRAPRRRQSVGGPLIFAGGVTAGLWALRGHGGSAFLVVLYLWSGLFASWVVLQLWGALGSALTVQQAKRLFGFIGAGSVLGAVIGAGSARVLASLLPPEHLLLSAAGLLVLTAIGPAAVLSRSLPAAESAASAKSGKAALAADLELVLRDPYLRKLLPLALSATVVFTLGDYLFKLVVARNIPAAELAPFFATFGVVTSSAALAVQLLLVGWLLGNLGVHRATLILPLLMLGSGIFLALSGGLVAAVLMKGFDGVLRHSLHRTSLELLQVPVPDGKRGRAKPLLDLIGQRGGQALASVGILAAVALGAPDALLAAVAVLVVVVWGTLAWTLRRPYLDLFRAAIWQGRLDDRGDLPELDLGALETLFAALNSSRDSDVLAALDLLAAQRRQRLIPALILYHPSTSVVLRALELFRREGRADYLPIAERLLTHGAPEVRSAALRAILSQEQDLERATAALADPRPELRATAAVALVARGEGARAQAALEEILAAGSTPLKIALARAIGEEPAQELGPLLGRLAQELDPEVRMEVAWAIGKSRDGALVPLVLPMIAERLAGDPARRAMAELGAPAREALDRLLSDPSADLALRAAAPRALAEMSAAEAAPILLRHLESAGDGLVEYRILRALSRLVAAAPDTSLAAPTLEAAADRLLRRAIELASWCAQVEAAQKSGPDTPALQLVGNLLRDKEAHAISRLFLILGLLHPGESFARIHRGLSSRDPKTRASSRELIENLIHPSLRAAVLAMIEELPVGERIARLPPAFRPAAAPFAALISSLAERGDELGALAQYHGRSTGLLRAAAPRRGSSATGALADALAGM